MFAAITPYMSIIKAVMVAMIFSAGLALGIHLEQSKIATLNNTIGSLQQTNKDLTVGVQNQNDAISKLQSDAKAREEAATKAVDAAKQSARSQYQAAQQILAKQHSGGSGACSDASQAFSDELEQERSK